MIFENNKKNIKLFIQKILNNEIIIFPTDTVFGIGCNATNTTAIEKIYKLKGRKKTKTLLLNFPNIKSIENFANLTKTEQLLLKTFGDLTIIVRAKENTKLSPLTIKNNEIGIRIPNNKTLQQILTKISTPLISTSCNKSGNSPCLTADNAEKIFPQIPILQTNEVLSGTPSTIIKISNNKIEILRHGSLSKETLQQILTKHKINIDII
ncbi:MAG: threonylcarbamoyl-AMP synthase [Alphaproteobacteria bacterium]|nr:threonylcarbamoyl-AMP synthase [Alphaproteobacteria bacterium]